MSPGRSYLAEERRLLGLEDPNPGRARYGTGGAFPAVMATPPTVGVTSTGQYPAWTLTGTYYDPTAAPKIASVARLFGANVTEGTDGGQALLTSATSVSVGGGTGEFPLYAVELMTDAPALEYAIRRKGGGHLIQVDGQWESLTPHADANDNGTNVYKLTFSGRAVRRITLLLSAPSGTTWLEGMRADHADSIWLPHAPLGKKVLVAGDSWTEPTGATYRGWAHQLADLLGWRDLRASGAGGTGYVNAGSRVNLQSRYVADVVAFAPDVVILPMGLNDTAIAQATLQAAVTAVVSGIRNSLPGATIIVISNFSATGSPSAAQLQTRDAIFAGAKSDADLLIDFLVNTGGARGNGTYLLGDGLPAVYDGTAAHYVGKGYVTGTGHVGATTGSGNGDVLINTDGAHPTQAGHDAVGAWMAQAIASVIPL